MPRHADSVAGVGDDNRRYQGVRRGKRPVRVVPVEPTVYGRQPRRRVPVFLRALEGGDRVAGRPGERVKLLMNPFLIARVCQTPCTT